MIGFVSYNPNTIILHYYMDKIYKDDVKCSFTVL